MLVNAIAMPNLNGVAKKQICACNTNVQA